MEQRVVKIVVGGPFAAGKTSFVNSAATGATVGSEFGVTDSTRNLKESTTVSMDHGVVELEVGGEPISVTLFGTPGQERFNFMWPILAQGMSAYVLLVDASRLQGQAQLRRVVRAFAEFAAGVPFLIAANRWDQETTSAADLAAFVGVPIENVVACDPRDRDECVGVIRRLVALAESSESNGVEG